MNETMKFLNKSMDKIYIWRKVKSALYPFIPSLQYFKTQLFFL